MYSTLLYDWQFKQVCRMKSDEVSQKTLEYIHDGKYIRYNKGNHYIVDNGASNMAQRSATNSRKREGTQ